MRTTLFAPLSLFAFALLAPACGSVKMNDSYTDMPAAGIVRGSVLYQGPHPCSKDGHIVGNLIILFFDQRNPPPPAGLANTAVNFGVIGGDVLFRNEPRNTSPSLFCPKDSGHAETITSNASFTVGPFDAGTYLAQAFYDYSGDFLPTHKFRNNPKAGDIGGGYVDTTDALKHPGDPNYQPIYFPIDVGVQDPTAPAGTKKLVMPAQGYVADGIQVSVGSPLTMTRPYFYPAGAEQPAQSASSTPSNTKGDLRYAPVATISQDVLLKAPPTNIGPDLIQAYQSGFASVRLNWGVPPNELGPAVDPSEPFHFQVDPMPKGGLFVWSNGKQLIPEGNLVRELYPIVVFAKLVDDPLHDKDPQSLKAQGNSQLPVVIIQGLTVADDSLFKTAIDPPGPAPTAATQRDHVTVLVRPSAICLNATRIQDGGLVVTPYFETPSADPTEKGTACDTPGGETQGCRPLFDQATILTHPTAKKLIRKFTRGCLPTGRYAINVVYPTGQAWTVPNETGSCNPAEGAWDPLVNPSKCQSQPRAVLASQGNRAVVEIVPAKDPQFCAKYPVPEPCIRNVPPEQF